MKCISWNVNGLRACVQKGFKDVFQKLDADIFCLQETKLQEGQIDLSFEGYHSYWNYALKKGYSGTAIFTKQKPLHVFYGIQKPQHDQEGRVITLEFEDYNVITVYTPNSKNELQRLDDRLNFEDAFLDYLLQRQKHKPIILCGDLNVAHQEIDLKNPQANHHHAGFTDQERQKMDRLLQHGFIDTFRYLYPDQRDCYSWWSYRFNARKNNAGWRIDYFIVSDQLKDKIQEAKIHADILGSDHCPIELDIHL